MTWLIAAFKWIKERPIWALIGGLIIVVLGQGFRIGRQKAAEARQDKKQVDATLKASDKQKDVLRAKDKASEADYIRSVEKERDLADEQKEILDQRNEIANEYPPIKED